MEHIGDAAWFPGVCIGPVGWGGLVYGAYW